MFVYHTQMFNPRLHMLNFLLQLEEIQGKCNLGVFFLNIYFLI